MTKGLHNTKTAYKKPVFSALLILMTLALFSCGKKEGDNSTLGFNKIAESDYPAAVESFNKAVEEGENLELAYRGLGLAYLGMADYDNALNAFENALSNGGIFAGDLERDINFYMATAYFKSSRPDEAAKLLDAIIESDEKNDLAHYERGVIAISEGDYESGIYHFEKALSYTSDDHEMKFNIYDVLAAYGYADKGREYLDSMLNDEKALSEYEQGLIFFRLGQYDDARNHLESAKQEERDKQADIVYMLGRTYEMLGDSNYAGVLYSEYLTKNPSNALIYNQLGLSKLAAGDAQGAILAFETGLELNDPSMKQALSYNRIVAYEKNGDFESAKALMNEYRLAYPDDPEALRESTFLQTR